MSLVKQNVSIDFTQGLDLKTDDKLSVPAIPCKMTQLKNLQFDSRNTLSKRPGYLSVDLSPSDRRNPPSPTVNVGTIRRLSAVSNDILIESDNGLHNIITHGGLTPTTYTQEKNALADDSWPRPSLGNIPFERAAIKYHPVADDAKMVPNPVHGILPVFKLTCDCALSTSSDGLYECYAWTEMDPALGTPKVFYKIVETTGDRLTVDHGLLGPGKNPQVISRDVSIGVTQFYIYFYNAGFLQLSHIKSQQYAVPFFRSTSPNLVAMSAAGLFDAHYDIATDLITVAVIGLSSILTITPFLGTNGFTIGLAGTQTESSAAGVRSVSVVTGLGPSATTRSAMVVWTETAGTEIANTDFNLTSGLLTTGTSVPVTGFKARRVMAIQDPYEPTRATVYFDVTPDPDLSDPFNMEIHYAGILFRTGVATSEVVVAKSVGLYGRPLTYLSGPTSKVCVPAALYSTLQPTVFLLTHVPAFGDPPTSRVLARILPGECGLLDTNTLPKGPSGMVDADGNFKFPFYRKGLPKFNAGLEITESGIWLAEVSLEDELSSVESQQSLLLAGASPHLYDGARVHEAGFNYYPEGITATAGSTGGAMATGTYGFVFLYEWEDAKGKTHQSTPSVPVSVAVTSGQLVTCTVPFYRLTSKHFYLFGGAAPDNAVRIVGYRTAVGGSIYYRDNPYPGSTDFNTLNALASGTWISWAVDADITSNGALYTTGGTLENTAFPACRIAQQHQRRTFMVMEGQRALQYTDETDEDFLAQATNDTYKIPVPPEGGEITALWSMDDKLFIFCETEIYFIFGAGPNRLGQQNSYSLPQKIIGNIGLPLGFQNAINQTSDGIWFYSSQLGPRLLTRGGELSRGPDGRYLGSEADALFEGVTAARAIVPVNHTQLQFFTDLNVIVYDFQWMHWSSYTFVGGSKGVVASRGIIYTADAAKLYAADSSAYVDDEDTQYDIVAETGWLAFGAGPAAHQRIYSLLLTATGLGSSMFEVSVGYNYDPTYTTVVTQALPAADPYQVEHCLTQQKCEAVRFKFRAHTSANEAIRLTNFMLQVGLKRGTFKVPSAQRF